MKTKKVSILILPFVLFSLLSCKNGGGTSRPSFPNSKINIFSTNIHTKEQENFIITRNFDYDSIYGNKELSKPLPIKMEWFDYGKESYTLEFNDITDGTDSYYIRDITSCYYEFYNAEVDTYYDVKLYDDNDNLLDENVFKSEICVLRNLNIGGVANCRDLGGYRNTNGKITTQGLIYRTARMNDSYTDAVKPFINEQGQKEMLDHLKIKTEIDLRQSSNNEVGSLIEDNPGVLGPTVKYVNAPLNLNGSLLNDKNHDSIAKVFEVLGDSSNYPVVFHCKIGTDRTGLIAYLINSLCNAESEDLKLDYLFSNFANIGGTRDDSILSTYKDAIYEYDGDTLGDKTYKFLTNKIGVQPQYLDTLLKMMNADWGFDYQRKAFVT